MMKDINKAIKNQVKKSRLTQEQIANVVGINRTALSAIMSETREVSANELLEFCKLFNIEPNILIGWKVESNE